MHFRCHWKAFDESKILRATENHRSWLKNIPEGSVLGGCHSSSIFLLILEKRTHCAREGPMRSCHNTPHRHLPVREAHMLLPPTIVVRHAPALPDQLKMVFQMPLVTHPFIAENSPSAVRNSPSPIQNSLSVAAPSPAIVSRHPRPTGLKLSSGFCRGHLGQQNPSRISPMWRSVSF